MCVCVCAINQSKANWHHYCKQNSTLIKRWPYLLNLPMSARFNVMSNVNKP